MDVPPTASDEDGEVGPWTQRGQRGDGLFPTRRCSRRCRRCQRDQGLQRRRSSTVAALPKKILLLRRRVRDHVGA